MAIEIWLPRNDRPVGEIAAVMALNSGIRPDGSLDQEGRLRLIQGTRLATSLRVPLYTSRVIRRTPPFLTSDLGQKRIVDSIGAPRWRILDYPVASTRDEALALRRALLPTRIAVVTSRLHTRRACAAFEAVGYEVTCVSAGREARWWLTPYFVAYESAAHVKYRLRGWQ